MLAVDNVEVILGQNKIVHSSTLLCRPVNWVVCWDHRDVGRRLYCAR